MNNYNETKGAVVVTPAQWEKRRYEIAKAVLSNPGLIEFETKEIIGTMYNITDIPKTVKNAVKIADMLIKELKGGEQ